MRLQYVISAILVFFLIAFAQSISYSLINQENMIEQDLYRTSLTSLPTHSEIIIGSNNDFETQGWPGNGSVNDPYRIQSLHITSLTDSIIIEDTTVFFVISDCLLDGIGTDWNYGVRLNNVSNGNIEDCTISKKGAIAITHSLNCNLTYLDIIDCEFGIAIGDWSEHCLIAHNKLTLEGWDGIRVENSEFVSVIDNAISGGRQFGILLDYSQYCNIMDNTITEFQWYGLRIDDSIYATIYNNSIMMSEEKRSEYQYGAYVSDCFGLEFINNTILGDSDASLALNYVPPALIENNTFDNGVVITSSSSARLEHNMANNIVQGKPLYYTDGLTDTVLDGSLYGQIILVDAINVTVIGGSFQNVSAAVTINTSYNCSIESSTMSGCDVYSILVQYSERIKITDVDVNDVNGAGIYVRKSMYSEIMLSTVTNVRSELNANTGIQLNDDCDNSIVVGNEIHHIEFTGIRAYASNNVSIVDNVVTDTASESLHLFACINCAVINNDLENGIRISEAWFLNEWMHNMTGNNIGSKDIGYFRNVDGITIDGSQYGQVFLVNCSNIVVNGLVTEDVIQGLAIVGSLNIDAHDITMSSLWAHDNRLYDYNYHMIILEYSSFCEISAVSITAASAGIRVYGCSNLTLHDISISYVSYAIETYYTLSFNIFSCELKYNRIGIQFLGVNDSVISQCSLLHNEIGVYLGYSYDNVVFANEIGWSTQYNAYDDYGSNTWDDNVDTGNAWSDYSGVGSYNIAGNSGSVDRYPTLLEVVQPTTTTTTPPITTSTTSTNGDFFEIPALYLTLAVTLGVVLTLVLVLLKRRQ